MSVKVIVYMTDGCFDYALSNDINVEVMVVEHNEAYSLADVEVDSEGAVQEMEEEATQEATVYRYCFPKEYDLDDAPTVRRTR